MAQGVIWTIFMCLLALHGTLIISEYGDKLLTQQPDVKQTWLNLGMPTTFPEESILNDLCSEATNNTSAMYLAISFKRRIIPNANTPKLIFVAVLILGARL